MTIDTTVFRRINDDMKRAAVAAVDETMAETVRFGGFAPEYRRACAADRVEVALQRQRKER